ncbi:DUF1456 family protein [Psychromonas antarctica]|jgi:uncharacterized protein YehS (DUF1456 family)|uniref:DUF1456 family protein n=1 Tax=Psychromonas antarctica TaxID=67573 RepID=UPI001EE91EB2|nr:DUF1456 family protein [Psychromonas antarctica]MCG6202783.1 DUF1456 family protein [Psychromonas antarctica]
MITNDVLRRVRYALQLNDKKMLEIFASVDNAIDESYLRSIMAKEGEENFIFCTDSLLSLFLDGLINEKRGKKEGSSPIVLPENTVMLNNDILRKLRIALNFKEDDMLDVLESAEFPVSKSELSALFRKKDHRNFKVCGDQLLRNFLNGITKRFRGTEGED